MIRLLKLFRMRLALLNGVSALAGFLLFPAPADVPRLCAVYAGAVLLAAGASALNQVQERDVDRLMSRTRSRPVASGVLSSGWGATVGIIVVMCGVAVVGVVGGWQASVIGGAIIAWYLAVYTPLKRRTSLALPLGALCGALVPVMGWCCAGGTPTDFRVILLGGLFYIWQIPHFWLFQRRHRNDYLRANIPLFEPGSGIHSACLRLWVCALCASMMLLPLFGLVAPRMSFLFALLLLPVLIVEGQRWNRATFSLVNCFPLVVAVSVFVGK